MLKCLGNAGLEFNIKKTVNFSGRKKWDDFDRLCRGQVIKSTIRGFRLHRVHTRT